VHDLTERISLNATAESKGGYSKKTGYSGMPKDDLKRVINEIENQMKIAAKELEFERAAALRDQLYELRAILAEESNLPPWKKAQLLSGEID
jgi:excinuclease ABC subunit B